MNDLSFFYYGMACVSLTLLGLLLTVLEFHRMRRRGVAEPRRRAIGIAQRDSTGVAINA
jgi:hypothetical protein